MTFPSGYPPTVRRWDLSAYDNWLLNSVTYVITPSNQNITSNVMSQDPYLLQTLPNLTTYKIDVMLRWNNPSGGGGFQLAVTANGADDFYLSDGDGYQHSSGDILQFSTAVGDRVERLTGTLVANSTAPTVSVTRALASSNASPTVFKANSIIIFTPMLPTS